MASGHGSHHFSLLTLRRLEEVAGKALTLSKILAYKHGAPSMEGE